MSRKQESSRDDIVEVLQDLLIVNLALGGVRQQAIREIVGCGIERVNAICKHIKAARKKGGE